MVRSTLRLEKKSMFVVDGEVTIESTHAIDDAVIVVAEANERLP